MNALRGPHLHKAVFAGSQALCQVGLLPCGPFLCGFPELSFLPFQAQKGSFQKLVGSAQPLLCLHPIAVIGGLIGQMDNRRLLVRILKLECEGLQGQHVVRRGLCLRTHIGVGRKIPLAVYTADRNRVKYRLPVLAGHHGLTVNSQCLVGEHKFCPGKLFLRVIRVALYQDKHAVRNLVLHGYRLQKPGIRHSKGNIHCLEKAVGRSLLPKDVIPRRYILYEMGL